MTLKFSIRLQSARALAAPLALLLSPLTMPWLQAQEIRKISLPLPADMIRADLYALAPEHPDPQKQPTAAHGTSPAPLLAAVLVLCPGANGNGESLIQQTAWQEFARLHRLGLVGLSFASDEAFFNDGGRGYYYASKGSGQALLEGIREIYGADLPLLLYGFSGGAHFTSRFTEWKPERVLAWCAYSAAWWDTPQKAALHPPGIVACGEEDPRYGASLIYFKQGRAAAKPWLWVSLPKIGHTTSPQLETFIRHYFAAILNQPSQSNTTQLTTVHQHQGAARTAFQKPTHATPQHPGMLSSMPLQSKGLWIDIDLKTPVADSQQQNQPSLTGWLPDRALFEEWKTIHRP